MLIFGALVLCLFTYLQHMPSWSKPINHTNLPDLTDFQSLTFDIESSDNESYLSEGLCVPNDRLEDIEFFPNFRDDPIRVPNQQRIRVDEQVENRTITPKNAEKLHREKTTTKKLPSDRKPFQEKNHYFSREEENKRCSHCETGKTPQWRMGPTGRGTLCNACGIKYLKGELLPEYRPLASPSFDTSKHSNYIRRIVRMKKSVYEDR